jgi:hypothetical protein
MAGSGESEAGTPVDADESPAADAEESPAADAETEQVEDDEDGLIQLQTAIPTDEEIAPDADPDASASGVEVHPETRSVTSTPADGEQPEA